MQGALVMVPLAVTPRAALLMVVRMPDDRLTPSEGMRARDERQATTTLDELADMVRDGNLRVLGDIATTNRNVRTIHGELREVSGRVERLERRVFGKVPPPLLPRPIALQPVSGEMPETSGEQTSMRPPHPSLLDTQGDLAELSGRVIALEAKQDTTIQINKQQSKAMGLAMPEASTLRKIGAFLYSRKGAEFFLTIATLVAAVGGCERAKDAAQRAREAVQHLPAEAP